MRLFLFTPNGLLPGLIAAQRKALGDWFPLWNRYSGVHQRLFVSIYFVWAGLFAWENLEA